MKTKRVPIVEKLEPPVGFPGKTLTIFGDNFGDEKNDSFVEIDGNRITASGYISWKNDEIQIMIPPNLQDGLLFVSTKAGKSRPIFFANEEDLPIVAPLSERMLQPTLSLVSPASGAVGSLVLISGSNFGSIRGNSVVVFRSRNSEKEICANERDFDYERWSDGEILVRVPDGAESGSVFVRTDKGESAARSFSVSHSVGTKTFDSEKIYALQLDEDIDSIDADSYANLTIRVPRPAVFSAQPTVTLHSCKPEPIIADLKNTVIHQVRISNSIPEKVSFTQDFVVTCRSVQTKINSKNVRPFSEKTRLLYGVSTKAAQEIAGKETNPYLIAKSAYEWIIKNLTLITKTRNPEARVLDALERNAGDAYDFSILYTAILRACGIPANSLAGVLVDADKTTRAHWWTQFYIENFGWIPVDVALGAGLPFSRFSETENFDEKSFYFGNLDDQHVAFSLGQNEIRPSLANGKIVRRPRSFAFQSVWEEYNDSIVNYSSLWNTPIVLGIY